jgi:hypothetical protein
MSDQHGAHRKAPDHAVAAGLDLGEVQAQGLAGLKEFVKVACRNLWRERKGKAPLPYPEPAAPGSVEIADAPIPPGSDEVFGDEPVAAVKPAKVKKERKVAGGPKSVAKERKSARKRAAA